MINQEQKNLIIKYSSERKSISEISEILDLSYSKIYYFLNSDKAKEISKKYYEDNKKELKEKHKAYSRKYYLKNKETLKEYIKKYFSTNKERKKEYDKTYNKNNKSKRKEYYEANKENKKEYDKNYYLKNKNKRKEQFKKHYDKKKAAERQLTRYHSDLNFRILNCLRSRMRSALKGTGKSAHTIELIGCSVEFLKDYLKKQFRDGMAWENYGKVWHIDHIIPCAAFDLTDIEQQKECFNYKNLQPLLAEENLSKNDLLPNGSRARFK